MNNVLMEEFVILSSVPTLRKPPPKHHTLFGFRNRTRAHNGVVYLIRSIVSSHQNRLSLIFVHELKKNEYY